MSNKDNKKSSRSAPYSIAQSFGAGIRKMLSNFPLPIGVSEMLSNKNIKTKADDTSNIPVLSLSSTKIVDERLKNQDSNTPPVQTMPVSLQYESQNISGIKRRQDISENIGIEEEVQSCKRIAMDIRGRPSISQFRKNSVHYSSNPLSLFSTINETLPPSKIAKPSFRELALTRSTDLSNLNESYTCKKFDSSFFKTNESIHYSNSSFAPQTPINPSTIKKDINTTSPFYKGETVYGGSASVNRRTSLPKFQKNKQLVSGNMETNSYLSSTAKKIFKALEEVETVKKIDQDDFPVLSQNSYSPYICKPDIYKRFSRGVLPILKSPPIASLSRPMISNEAVNICQFDESAVINKELKYIGKIKTGKQSQRIENEMISFEQNSDGRLQPIELPNIKLKPFFEADEFKFSQPITKKIINEINQMPSNFDYKFNEPVLKSIPAPDDFSTPKESLSDYKFNINMAKRKDSISNAPTSINLPSLPLKQGNILDALKSMNNSTPLVPLSSIFKNSNNWTCPTCMVSNHEDKEVCPCCNTSKTLNNVAPVMINTTLPTTLPSLANLFKQSTNKWRCDNCFVENVNTLTQCACCQASKPMKKLTEVPPTINTTVVTPLSLIFKKSGDKWTCPECFVSNNNTDQKCPCCHTVRPASINDPNQNNNEFKEKTLNCSNELSVSNINNNYLKSGSAMVTFQFGNDKTKSNTTLTNSNDAPLTNGMLMSTNSDMYQISAHCFQTADTSLTENKGFTLGKNQNTFSENATGFKFQPINTTGEFNFSNHLTDLKNQNKLEIVSKNSLLHPIQFKPKVIDENIVNTSKDKNLDVPQSNFNFGSSNLISTIDSNSKSINTKITQNSGLFNLNENVASRAVTTFKGFQNISSATIIENPSNTLAKLPTISFDSSVLTTSNSTNTIQPINFGLNAPSSVITSSIQPFNFNSKLTSEVPSQPSEFSLLKSDSTTSSKSEMSMVNPINFNLPISSSVINVPNQIQFNFGQITKTIVEQTSVSYQFSIISTSNSTFTFGKSVTNETATSKNQVTSSIQSVLTNGILGSTANVFGNSLSSHLTNSSAVTPASSMFNFGATKSIETTNLFATNPTLQSNIFNFGSSANNMDAKISNFLAPNFGPTTTSSTNNNLFNFQPITTKTSNMFQFEPVVTQATIAPSQTNGGFFNFDKATTTVTQSNQPFSFGNFQSGSTNTASVAPAAFNFSQTVIPQQQSQSFVFGQGASVSSASSLFNSSGFNFTAATNGLPQNFSFTGNNTAQATPFQFGQNSASTSQTGYNFQQAAVVPSINQPTFAWNSQPPIDQLQAGNIVQPFNFVGNNPAPLINFSAPAGNQSGRRIVRATRKHHR